MQSHLSGASLRVDGSYFNQGAMTIELLGFRDGVLVLEREGRIDFADVDFGSWQHVYWEPLEASLGRIYLLRVSVVLDGAALQLGHHRMLLDAKLVHSPPDPAFGLPKAILFSPVTQCNLNCPHCVSKATRSKMSVVSDQVWAEVVRAAKAEDFQHIASDYSGDILFNERRHEGWLSRIIAQDIPFRIDTNANCLDDDIIEKLVASRLKEINFSLDTMDPGLHRKVRRGSIPLGEVLEKIARFMGRKRETGLGARTILTFGLMKSTAPTIKPALGFAHHHGIDYVNVFPMIAFTADMADEVFVWDTVAYEALYGELTAEAARLGVNLFMEPPVQRFSDRDVHEPCLVPWGSMVVLGNGDVQACCVPGTRIANMNGKAIEDVWNGPEFREFRSRVNTSNPPPPCRNCPMSRVRNNRKAYAPGLYVESAVDNALPISVRVGGRITEPAG